VDESGIDEHFYRQRARSAVGKKVFGFVPGKKYCRTNIVAGYVNGKTMAECVYDGTMNGQFFNAWVESFPSLLCGPDRSSLGTMPHSISSNERGTPLEQRVALSISFHHVRQILTQSKNSGPILKENLPISYLLLLLSLQPYLVPLPSETTITFVPHIAKSAPIDAMAFIIFSQKVVATKSSESTNIAKGAELFFMTVFRSVDKPPFLSLVMILIRLSFFANSRAIFIDPSGLQSSTRIISIFLYVCATMQSKHSRRYFSTL
jgi:hypothetical protein